MVQGPWLIAFRKATRASVGRGDSTGMIKITVLVLTILSLEYGNRYGNIQSAAEYMREMD